MNGEKWIRLLRQETRDSQNNSSHFANSWCFQVIFNLSVGICTSLAYCSLSAHLCFLTVLAHQQERMSSEIVLCSSSQEWQLFLLAWCRSVCEREWERQRVTHWLCSSEVILDLLLMPKGVPACFTALCVCLCVCTHDAHLCLHVKHKVWGFVYVAWFCLCLDIQLCGFSIVTSCTVTQ